MVPLMSFSPTYPFQLPELPPNITFNDEKIIALLLKARTELGELKGYTFSIPNPMLLLSPAILKEAIASSQIENINTTIENVLQLSLFPENERRQPDKEVQHYHDAILWGFKNLPSLQLSSRMTTGIHSILLPEGDKKFRRTPNKIENTLTKKILYTPPNANEIPRLMSNWENFVHAEDEKIDVLVRCALAHYQFEAIHPFGDGNGRTGRITAVLYLVQKELLSLPILFISGYINKNRNEYYKLLLNVSAKGEWNEFVLFMLRAIYFQAKETKKMLLNIKELYEKYKELVKSKHKNIYTADLVDILFAHPIITPVAFGKKLDAHYTTASKYLAELVKGKILKDEYVGKYHLFINHKLMNILNG
jgi:Fic family protein